MRRTVLDLIGDGVLGPPVAALIWALLIRRSSMVVVAGASGTGKTTLLTALLDLLPGGEDRIYLRGSYEPFDFLGESAVEPARTTLLVNEISPHLPMYLWGAGVRRLFAAGRSGFQILATAHATGAQELVGVFAGYPLRIPTAEITALQIVVVVDAWLEGEHVRRRVVEVTGLEATVRGGVMLQPLLVGDRRATVVDLPAALRWLARSGESESVLRDELADRARALASLAGGDRGRPDRGVSLREALLAEFGAQAGGHT